MPTPPQIPVELPADYEAVRRAHLTHETSVRSVGLLYFLGAGMLVVAAIVGLVGSGSSDDLVAGLVTVAILAFFAVIYVMTGRWLRVLNPQARIPATILSIIGLLSFPIGTIINLYILYLLHSAKGKYVFTPEYAAIVAATPEIKYKTSLITKIALGVLVVLLATIVIGVVFGS